MADGMGFGGAPITQVIEQRGGGTLNFVRSVVENVQKSRKFDAAKEDYEPVAKVIADQIDAGDFGGAARQLSRQYHELAQKHGEEAAAKVVSPGFQHLVYISGLPPQGAQRPPLEVGGGGMVPPMGIPQGREPVPPADPTQAAATAATYDPRLGAVKLSQVAKNTEAAKSSRALGGLRGEQMQSERELRPLMKTGQIATTGLRGAQAGAAGARGAFYQGQVAAGLPQAQADAAKAQAEADRARAAQPPTASKGPQPQTPRLIQNLQRKLVDMQDIGKMGLADAERAQVQMQGEVDIINAQAEREGYAERARLDRVGDVTTLSIDRAPAPGPPPVTTGGSSSAGLGQTVLDAVAQRAGMPGLGGAAATPPPLPDVSGSPLPTMTPNAAPAMANVGDLSRLIPESVAALAKGQSVGASQVIAELGKQHITDPARIREILGALAASSGQ